MSIADPWRTLRGIRLGCVKYLNSRPLIHAYDGPVIFEHPSSLARLLATNQLDAALVPVFETLRDPRYVLVKGATVACQGPVFSVFLAYRGSLQDIRSIALDPASLTSANLLRVLLAEYHGLQPAYGSTGEAQLLIGNQAIEFRLAHESEGWNIFDLGEEWLKATGLPFVFAAWAIRQDLPNVEAIADSLRALRTVGQTQLAEIVAGDDLGDAEMRHRYLTEHIQFDTGEAGRQAVAKYRELLTKYGAIAPSSEPLRWV